jgi:3-deoxy-D-manno-octulosonate 8-phosphate phosphatase (KDO 8-P phosphatase)
MKFPSSLLKKCKHIKIVLTDVDGVLTNGGMYYSVNGDIMKKFHARDGMGVNILKRIEIKTMIVTKEQTKIVRQWAKKMNVAKVYDGILEKELIIDKICKLYNVKPKNIAFIGDDVNDISLLEKVGFSATPNDGIDSVKKICNYVCKNNGGNAAFREIVDLIVSSKN